MGQIEQNENQKFPKAEIGPTNDNVEGKITVSKKKWKKT